MHSVPSDRGALGAKVTALRFLPFPGHSEVSLGCHSHRVTWCFLSWDSFAGINTIHPSGAN